jgi:hypothetical protein
VSSAARDRATVFSASVPLAFSSCVQKLQGLLNRSSLLGDDCTIHDRGADLALLRFGARSTPVGHETLAWGRITFIARLWALIPSVASTITRAVRGFSVTVELPVFAGDLSG